MTYQTNAIILEQISGPIPSFKPDSLKKLHGREIVNLKPLIQGCYSKKAQHKRFEKIAWGEYLPCSLFLAVPIYLFVAPLFHLGIQYGSDSTSIGRLKSYLKLRESVIAAKDTPLDKGEIDRIWKIVFPNLGHEEFLPEASRQMIMEAVERAYRHPTKYAVIYA